MIGSLKRALMYGIPILILAMICPSFWLILGVTLAGLLIGVSLVYTALERCLLKTRSRRLKRLALTAAIVLYFVAAMALTHYLIISGLNDAAAMACHDMFVCHSVSN